MFLKYHLTFDKGKGAKDLDNYSNFQNWILCWVSSSITESQSLAGSIRATSDFRSLGLVTKVLMVEVCFDSESFV